MYSKKWITSIFGAIVLLGSLSPVAMTHELSNQEIAGQGGDFSLNSFDGRVSLQDLLGDVVLLFFGYTSCVDVCPTTLWDISKALNQLTPKELDKTTTLFISLDPDRDTLEKLHQYTQYFHTNIIGVTENMEVLTRLMEDYGIAYERKEEADSALGYVIYHTPDVLVINPQGKLLAERIVLGTSTEIITAKIRNLIADYPYY